MATSELNKCYIITLFKSITMLCEINNISQKYLLIFSIFELNVRNMRENAVSSTHNIVMDLNKVTIHNGVSIVFLYPRVPRGMVIGAIWSFVSI